MTKLTQTEWNLVRKALRNLGVKQVRVLHDMRERRHFFGFTSLTFDTLNPRDMALVVDSGLAPVVVKKLIFLWALLEPEIRRREGIWLNETEGRQRRKRERNQAERIKRQSQSVSAGESAASAEAKLASKDEEVAG